MKYFILALFFVGISIGLLLNSKPAEPIIPTQPIIEHQLETGTETPSQTSEQPLLLQTSEYSTYVDPQGYFELPLEGATGYASIPINVRGLPSSESTLLCSVSAGTGFTIIEEVGDWWQVKINGEQGYVYHDYCLLNLPDVLPSIIYQNTNSTQAVFTSSYLPIPNISVEQLYKAMAYNERLGREEYMMPVLYGTAKKIAIAQKSAKNEGNSLILYEAYRPYEVQVMIREELRAINEINDQIKVGISTSPWSTNWFISAGISNHQRGFAVDISYATIIEMEQFLVGEYLCETVSKYDEAVMPTPIHELSALSISMAYPVNSNNDVEWRTTPLSETMNHSAIKLREYCTEAGLTPLASEWWHFNDLDYYGKIKGTGDFFLTEVFSVAPC
ncbi:MAG: M15 family metallopeptidase [Eubacteriales bacterium]